MRNPASEMLWFSRKAVTWMRPGEAG